ncbi:inactive ubiquitin thioesterase OTULINL isoform 3 [Mus musculus]|uniref:Isoform 2 of Inactive ubiquitin thioesterase OTULINL n=1 Tax=Mus musculus TaxID=10090 RepID=Q3TVP5-2|nr:inactive ubiquitin thioesterase OTULINL isoform 3 [Mus musculus]AAH52328.1 Family with sequence similarity 105, member A [Mus musculus]|eukprot:NP_938043.1 inactive ubiquitin thioesterase OTULINL isoform 3 [Mus musculus]
MEAPRSAPRERERARTTSGSDQVHSWILVTSQVLSAAWRIARAFVMTTLSPLSATFSYFRSLYLYLGHQLKWWIGYLQRKFKRNLSVEAEVDLLSYCAREWKGEAPRARLMRKLPEKLLFSQGCNWIQQYSFGPEKYTGSNVFGKLRKCVELLKLQWTEFSGMRDHHKRGSMCNSLFSDAILECKLYEALKFLMLYQVTEAYEQMKTNKVIPSLFRLLFSRESSPDPLSFMMNHLNSIGDTCGLDQIDMFILGYSLQVKIKVFRLFKFNSRDFAVCYPEEPLREWPEISLLTENGHHYHIPVF